MVKYLLIFSILIFFTLPSMAQEQEATEPYRPCISSVMPGNQGRVIRGDDALFDQPSSSDSRLLREMPEGTVFTVLEGPVCPSDDRGWIKIKYQEDGHTYEGWYIVLYYGGCEACRDDPPATSALTVLDPLVPVSRQDNASIPQPPSQPVPNALTPETISGVVQLDEWGEGFLRNIDWTDKDLLQLTTSDEERLYDASTMTLLEATPHHWLTGKTNPSGTLLLMDNPSHSYKIIVREVKTERDLVVLDGYGGVFDSTGQYLAVNVPSTSMSENSSDLIRVYDMLKPDQPVIVQSFADVGYALLFKDRWLISSDDWMIYALDIDTATVHGFQDGLSEGFGGARLSPDGKWLALLNTYRFVEIGFAPVRHTLVVYRVDKLPPSPVSSYLYLREDLSNSIQQEQRIDYAWSPDSQTLLATTDHSQTAYRLNRGYFEEAWTMNVPHVISVTYSPDGSRFALITDENEILIYDETQLLGRLTSSAFSGRLAKVAFSPDHQWLAAGDFTSSVVIWDIPSSQQLSSLALNTMDRFQLSPDEKTFQTGRRVYDLQTGDLVKTLPAEDALKLGQRPSTQTLQVKTKSDPFNQVSVSIENKITGDVVQTFEHTFEDPQRILLSPDGQTMVVFDNRTAQVGDWRTDLYLLRYDVDSGDLLDVKLLGDVYFKDSVISRDGHVVFWTVEQDSASEGGIYDFTMQTIHTFPLEGDDQTNPGYITLNADGSLAFLLNREGHLVTWNTITGQPITVPALDSATIGQAVVSQDGTRLYTVDGEGHFSIWGLPQ